MKNIILDGIEEATPFPFTKGSPFNKNGEPRQNKALQSLIKRHATKTCLISGNVIYVMRVNSTEFECKAITYNTRSGKIEKV